MDMYFIINTFNCHDVSIDLDQIFLFIYICYYIFVDHSDCYKTTINALPPKN